MSFSTLGLSKPILRAIDEQGYTTPTPIQKQAIPIVLAKKDVLAGAQTGTGKTAGFTLPLLQLLSDAPQHKGKRPVKALILTPTRELAAQVAESVHTYGKYLPFKSTVIFGGVGSNPQIQKLKSGVDIVIATPGRLLDLANQGYIDLSTVDFFVLDEADRMLDMGFIHDIKKVLALLPKKRQNLLFSATYPEKILNIASKITKNPLEISIEEDVPTVETISQRVIETNVNNRASLLRHLIKTLKLKNVLVFMANKRATDNIAFKFRKYGFTAESFHGDLSQEDRTYTLSEFKDKKINILFATDIAARGLDIDNIECVVNYDLPRSPTDYIHRIGRTARAGKSGLAISFISHEDKAHFEVIEKKCKVKIKREQIEGFELTGEAPKVEKGPTPVKGKGKSKKDKLREKALKESK